MIAVTGANGLLGSFLIRKLVESGHSVIGFVRKGSDLSLIRDIIDKVTLVESDITDYPSLTENLKGVNCLIHAAALVSFNPKRAIEIFETNKEGTKNVVDACLASGIAKLIYVSSVAALGRDKEIKIIDENNKWIESDLNSDYAKSKYLAELEVYRGHEEGLNISIVNPSVILAPSDWSKSSSVLFKYVWNENPFYIDRPINYVDVRDVVDSILKLNSSDYNGERFILNGGAISLKVLLDGIARRFNKKPPYIAVNSVFLWCILQIERLRCIFSKKEPLVTSHTIKSIKAPFVYNNSKASKVLGTEFHSLEKTLDWCCEGYLRIMAAFSTNK